MTYKLQDSGGLMTIPQSFQALKVSLAKTCPWNVPHSTTESVNKFNVEKLLPRAPLLQTMWPNKDRKVGRKGDHNHKPNRYNRFTQVPR